MTKLQRYRKSNGKTVKIMCYRDDFILIADTKDNLQRLFHKIRRTAKTYNNAIYTSKTNTMLVSKEAVR